MMINLTKRIMGQFIKSEDTNELPGYRYSVINTKKPKLYLASINYPNQQRNFSEFMNRTRAVHNLIMMYLHFCNSENSRNYV